MKSTIKLVCLALAGAMITTAASADAYEGPRFPDQGYQYPQNYQSYPAPIPQQGYSYYPAPEQRDYSYYHEHDETSRYIRHRRPLPPPVVVPAPPPVLPYPGPYTPAPQPYPYPSQCAGLPPPNPNVCRIVRGGPYGPFGVWVWGRVVYWSQYPQQAHQYLCDLLVYGHSCY